MLSILIWLPVLGALVISFFPGTISAPKTRQLALVIASILFGFSVLLLRNFDLNNGGMQFQELIPWIPTLGINYTLGVDGLSLPLVVLNALLTWIVIYTIPPQVDRARLYHALVFLVSAGVYGSFVAQNLLLFVFFYELELIPLYLLIAIWGSKKKEYAAMKFLIYTAVSGVLILGGFLALGWLSHSASFDLKDINTAALPVAAQITILAALLIGFGIKTPLVPFHTWLPDAYVESSTPVVILLGGILAKLGAYGLVRFCLALFPEAWVSLAPILATWAVVSVMYGALAAIAQKDIKRMVAYSSIGHMGYVLFGLAAFTPLSILGAVCQMVSHGFILAILFYLVGNIEDKVGTRELDVLNGLMSPIRGLPFTSAALVLAGMASAGIPGLVGFISEFLVFQGSFTAFPVQTILCIVASGLTAVYFVILLNRTCFGKLDNKTAYYGQTTVVERVPAYILAGIIFFLGVQPSWLVRWSEKTTANFSASATAYLEPAIATTSPWGSDLVFPATKQITQPVMPVITGVTDTPEFAEIVEVLDIAPQLEILPSLNSPEIIDVTNITKINDSLISS